MPIRYTAEFLAIFADTRKPATKAGSNRGTATLHEITDQFMGSSIAGSASSRGFGLASRTFRRRDCYDKFLEPLFGFFLVTEQLLLYYRIQEPPIDDP